MNPEDIPAISKPQPHSALGYGIAIAACVIVALILLKKQAERTVVLPHDVVLAEWRKHSFVPVSDSEEFRSRINAIEVKSAQPVSADKLAELRDTVWKLIMAYYIGTYDAYRQYRTPLPARTDPDVIEHTRKGLAYLIQDGESIPDDPDQVDRLFFERLHGDEMYVGYWEGLDLDTFSISVDESRKIPDGVGADLFSKPNVGSVGAAATFVFPRQPQTVLADEGKLIFATLNFIVKPKAPDNPYPQWHRFYWDGEAGKWLPMSATFSYFTNGKRMPLRF